MHKYPLLVMVHTDEPAQPGQLTRLVGDALTQHRRSMPDGLIRVHTVSETETGRVRRQMLEEGMELRDIIMHRILEVSGEADQTRARLAADDILDQFLRSPLADDMQRELYLDMPGPDVARPKREKPVLSVVSAQPRKVLPGEWPWATKEIQ